MIIFLKKQIQVGLQKKIVRVFLFQLAQLWMKSWRLKPDFDPEKLEHCIIGVWHQDLMISVQAFQKQNFHILISTSKDALWLKNLCQKKGYHLHFGSSNRLGAKGVRSMLSAISTQNQQKKFCMALDGPTDPCFKNETRNAMVK